MTTLLLTYGKKEDYVGCSKLIGMKTPDSGAFVGFSSKEAGNYLISEANLPAEDFDLVDAQTAFSGMCTDNLNKLQIILFRNEHDVDIFIQDRDHFPYSEYLFSAEEIVTLN